MNELSNEFKFYKNKDTFCYQLLHRIFFFWYAKYYSQWLLTTCHYKFLVLFLCIYALFKEVNLIYCIIFKIKVWIRLLYELYKNLNGNNIFVKNRNYFLVTKYAKRNKIKTKKFLN